MNKRKLYIVAILIASTIASSYSQVTIKGTITGEDNDPIPGANIYLKDTYDGTSSKSDGTYQFSTDEKVQQFCLLIIFPMKPMRWK
jgi:protocatechuate 3,4-dioxygenase beta subunit